jgi:SAM-dependent methyltransferase
MSTPENPTFVRDMYDSLSWYVQFENWRAHGSRFADFTLHKALAVPGAGTRHVNDVLLEHGGLGLLFDSAGASQPRVLDAGCGFGGTMFALHDRLGGTYDGLTISATQLRAARREARRRGIGDACRFHLRSFDDPIADRHDAVVAVESLSHAPDLRRTLANLATALKPGGTLLIIEDMVVADIDARHPEEARILHRHWGCSRFPREEDYETHLRDAGLAISRRLDLTPLVRHRTVRELDQASRRYAAWSRWLPIAPARRVLSAYIGGLALEKLYARGEARYKLLVATAPG